MSFTTDKDSATVAEATEDAPQDDNVAEAVSSVDSNLDKLVAAVLSAIEKSATEPVPQGGVTVGLVNANGSFVSNNFIEKNGLRVERSGTHTSIVAKGYDNDPVLKSFDSVTGEDKSSDVSAAESKWGFIDEDNALPPPWDFPTLLALFTQNDTHAAAIETKAGDYAYNGWELILRPETQALIEANQLDEKSVEEAREEASMFLRSSFEGRPIEDLTHAMSIDFEVLGTCGTEILRDGHGIVKSLNHLPFFGVRWLNETARKKSNALYLQKQHEAKAFYVDWEYNIEYADGFDPKLTPLDEWPKTLSERENFVRRKIKDLVSRNDGKPTKDRSKTANEIFVVQRQPFTLSTKYGTPSGITALGALLALSKIEQFNLEYFDAKGVPQYAVVFEGMTPPGTQTTSGTHDKDQPDPAAATSALLKEFFTTKLAASERGVLVLQAYGDAKVRFERLTAENIEASFAEYEKRCVERVRMAHRIPPAALGVIAIPQVVGEGSVTQQLKRYRDHIVAPGQRVFANFVNEVLRSGLLIPWFEFKFTPMDIEEETATREFKLKEFDKGAITVGEYTASQGYADPPDDVKDKRLIPKTKLPIGDDWSPLLQAGVSAQNQAAKMLGSIAEEVKADIMDDVEAAVLAEELKR